MSAGETRSASDELLVARLRGGDRDVLGELFALHRERLCRMLHFRMDRRLLVRIDPDDVLQEAFLAATTRIDRFTAKPDASFFVWLRLVVMQTLIDQHRHHLGADMRDARRDKRLERNASGTATSACLAAQLAASLTSPSQNAAGIELMQKLERAIATMAPVDQEIIALRHFEDLTNTEAAEVLDLSPTAASNRYVRAIARLKEILSPFGE